ncbi:molybdopterin molybdotransferase [Capronia coronata CBS 617.96]|uniref:Molybdopterin molybdotransferase n=1 Tax=Capronia coronata CBS 617.96 TaxID=1182541 RepID=W9Y821_9EURO|nr:molybdopterin molybdotransferase [Capronia coronata CBS 617.96]EXJ78549.1 molybdopterin molybdotransferase [Capronia coronata CBS 617.96]
MSTSSFLRPAILIVSDTAAADPSTDKAAPTLKETFSQEGGGKWAEPIVEIVRDDILEIQRVVRSWTDHEPSSASDSGPINLVVTTGGTGFARRDYTPEAIAPLIHRHAPGIVHGMLAASFQVTPFAMMSRPVAGVRNKSVIITLPGSPKGAKENLQAVLKLLPHACLQAAGEDSRAAHSGGTKKLEKDAGLAASGSKPTPDSSTATGPDHGHNHDHSHHHDHDHDHAHGSHGHGHGHKIPKAHTVPSERPQSNDPRLGATARARSSPYPMLTVQEAVSKILEKSPSPTTELRDLSPDLTGYVVSEDIRAAEAVPAYRASIVDGYAVIIADTKADDTTTNSPSSPTSSIKGTFPVASVSHAQAASLPPPLQPGQIARITTGAPLPANANAVVMVEDTTIASTTADGSEEAAVAILTDELAVGENIREPGSDIALGSMVLKRGTMISPLGGEIGVLAASGTQKVPVYRKPRVGVMSTGDEVCDISHTGPLTGGMIRDSNRPSLLTLLRGWRLCEEVVDLGVARDTPATELEEKLRSAFREHELDVVLTTGGVSMGELDLLKPTVERALGGTVHFGRVSMKPGKPTTFASVPVKDTHTGLRAGQEKLLFGLPGNPASALVTANLFVLPCLQKMAGLLVDSGADHCGLQRVKVRLAGRVRCDKARVEYHRVVVHVDPHDGRLVATSTGFQRSSRVGSLATANALLELPQQEGWIEAGGECEALMMGMVLGY